MANLVDEKKNTGRTVEAHGKTFEFEGHDKIRPDFLETVPWVNKLPQIIAFETHEFTAVCPFSGLPDISRLMIEYVPSDVIVELRSIKYYMTSFRSVGIYQEEATDRIAKDLGKLLDPKYLKVTTVYNTRGGFDTAAVVEVGDRDKALDRS